MSARPPVQILGAGLAGMSAGHHLGGDYEIHERQDRPGGHAITVEENGYRFDRTGHLLHLRHEDIRRWVLRLLPDTAIEVQRRSRVFSHGVYTRYPYQANTFGLPPQVAYECLDGFLRTLAEQDAAPEPETFEQFCLAYFGEGFSKHFMIPFNSKMWGVHPREITAQWCSRFVPRPALQDVIAGAVGLHDRELGYNTEFLYPPLGIGTLSDALAAAQPGKIHLGSAPQAVDFRRRRLVFDDREVPYRTLISTAPLDVLIRLLVDPPPSVAAAAGRLRCNPLRYLDVALDVPCGTENHWTYVPEQRYPFYRVGCYSNFSEKMAPEGKACLYVELSSREPPDMNELMPLVTQSLMDMKIIRRAEDIAFVRPRIMEHAYVVFDKEHESARERIHTFLLDHGIISCGRYGGWDYSSMEDALIAGRQAAQHVREISK